MTDKITIEVAPGELIDKITILAIKLDRIEDADKRANVFLEYDLLLAAQNAGIPLSSEVEALTSALRAANEALWDIEDRIRDYERRSDFGQEFVELARAVYKTNDKRAAIKREINALLGSRLVEEKSYHSY